MKLTLLELGAWVDMLFGESKPGEAFYGGWGNITRDPDFAVATLLHSPGAWTGAHDAKSDELIDCRQGLVRRGRAQPRSTATCRPISGTTCCRPCRSCSAIFRAATVPTSQGYELYPTAVQDFWPVEIA